MQFMLRAGIALNRITRQYENKTIVLVCHGGVIDAAFHLFLHLSALHLAPASFDTHNASITHWYRTVHEIHSLSWSLESYNDAIHLRDLHSPTRIPWREIAGQLRLDDL